MTKKLLPKPRNLDLSLREENLINQIHMIRGEKVMLDFDLAMLYGVETRVLKQAVKRNIKRFPKDFMYILTKQEFTNLTSQFVMSSYGGLRHLPYAFTEQGVAMLSSVLKSDKAVEVNIAIMRTFVQLRKYAFIHKEIFDRLDTLESSFESLKDLVVKLIIQEEKPKRRIGFTADVK
ncbi:MAG: ORF6N domain-containing protein [Bacteroidetes bacterium]|nr:MAG: ORF6N domain-containing protein [Bacteroidota bacterium]